LNKVLSSLNTPLLEAKPSKRRERLEQSILMKETFSNVNAPSETKKSTTTIITSMATILRKTSLRRPISSTGQLTSGITPKARIRKSFNTMYWSSTGKSSLKTWSS
jgi:hypothetical protein